MDELGEVRFDKMALSGYVRTLRPQFLPGSAILFLIGSLFAGDGVIHANVEMALALLTVVLVQLAGHLANDYFDREGDRPSQRSLFAGGSGAIQTGVVSARAVLHATMAVFAFALLLAAIVAVISERPWFLPLIALGLFGGYAYSAPPLRLASTWLNELSIALLLGFGLPLAGWYFTKGTFDLDILKVGLPLFLFSVQSLIAVQFPDMEADRASGKRNMTFRLGIQRSKMIQTSLLGLSYLIVVAEVAIGYLEIGALLVLVTIPFYLYYSWKLIGMEHYDFNLAMTASNMAMALNGVSMAMVLIYLTVLTR